MIPDFCFSEASFSGPGVIQNVHYHSILHVIAGRLKAKVYVHDVMIDRLQY